jgi:hypothetical protein
LKKKASASFSPANRLFAMAGLWQPDAEGGKFTMLTTTPNASVSTSARKEKPAKVEISNLFKNTGTKGFKHKA